MRRRRFVGGVFGGILGGYLFMEADLARASTSAPLPAPQANEDVFAYIKRLRNQFDRTLYAQILGAANDFKEGDAIVGVAASSPESRQIARTLLARTRLEEIDSHPLLNDDLKKLIDSAIEHPNELRKSIERLGDLKQFLLTRSEHEIHSVMRSLSSDCIACVVKLMSNAELIAVGAKVFNPLPNSQIGARGYLGARIQPNSPTDHVEDIRWQVFDGFAYAVGDVLLGTNPVSSDPDSVAAIERTLQDVLKTFGIDDAMPHCVLSHIDVQSEVEKKFPGSTELWFQSIAGNDSANATFDLTVEKMIDHAKARSKGKYGLYFETGQGADFTNGHAHGLDMLIHESRKYGFARALTKTIVESRKRIGLSADAWVHVNDVAGFIGPEVFRTKEQLVRCCLEDIVMGKLHGLTIGLDVCSTLHMDVSLADLDWCLEQVAPANPAYLMALPTKIDPMLGYLTTGYQDHVRLRERFGLKVNDRMWKFFISLGVLDSNGKPTDHFGDPLWVYWQYRRLKGDPRTKEAIYEEGKQQLRDIRNRGVFIASGYGEHRWDLSPSIESEIDTIYQDAKKCIWREWEPEFVASLPSVIPLRTMSSDRSDYILHPSTGETLSESSQTIVAQLRSRYDRRYNTLIVISEGLNALAAMEPGHLGPLIQGLREGLERTPWKIAPDLLVVHSGRVRAGYRIGELFFQGSDAPGTIIHIIGERPGSGHRTLSAYLTTASGSDWSVPNRVDHNITKVVSGIAETALKPTSAARACVALITGKA